MKKHSLHITYTDYDKEDELPASDLALVKAAREAATRAYSPYSGFCVGAAVLLENGIVVEGNNQENAAYPSGLCAERVAMFAASSQYPGVRMEALAVTARSEAFNITEPVSPCGGCRQVMAEYESRQQAPLRLILCGASGPIRIINNVSGLLPFLFNASALKPGK